MSRGNKDLRLENVRFKILLVLLKQSNLAGEIKEDCTSDIFFFENLVDVRTMEGVTMFFH